MDTENNYGNSENSYNTWTNQNKVYSIEYTLLLGIQGPIYPFSIPSIYTCYPI
jgi:hypothetical protein